MRLGRYAAHAAFIRGVAPIKCFRVKIGYLDDISKLASAAFYEIVKYNVWYVLPDRKKIYKKT